MAILNKNDIYSAVFTTYNDRWEPDTGKFRSLLKFEMDHGVEGFYCCGSTGEGLLLDTAERKKIAEAAAEETSGRFPFIVHTGALSTRTAIELSSHAKSCGAAAVSLIPPVYYQYTPDEIEQYYRDVTEAVDIGVIVYNIPHLTGISFSKKNAFLNDDRILGMKHTSMNLYDLERLRQAFPGKILFNGFDEVFLYGLAAGADSAIGTFVNTCPKLFKAIQTEFFKNNISRARELQTVLNDFIEAVVPHGVIPAAKYSLTLQGIDTGSARKPFTPLNEEAKRQIEAALEKIRPWL